MLFADIRGHLFARETQSAPSTVIDEAPIEQVAFTFSK